MVMTTFLCSWEEDKLDWFPSQLILFGDYRVRNKQREPQIPCGMTTKRTGNGNGNGNGKDNADAYRLGE